MKGYIYKLISNKTDDIYIGSTTKPLKHRLSDHRYDYIRYNNGRYGFVSSFKIIQYTGANIILIETVDFEDKKQLLLRERFYIEQTDNCINHNLPSRSNKEYYKTNRSRIIQQRNEKLKLKKAEQIKQELNEILNNAILNIFY